MDDKPLVSVVRGAPTPEEVAALVGALLSRSTGVDDTVAAPAATAWTRSARPGARPASWRESGKPR